MDLTIFDVEHGACALLECDDRTRLMIDCGHNSSTGWHPGRHLRRQGITHLDLLAITNYDEDHASGLPDLLSQVSVGRLWRNRSVTPATLKQLKSEDGMGPGIDRLVDMAAEYSYFGGEEPVFEGLERRAFWNEYPLFDDENNLSMVLELRCHGHSFLFPGDLEASGWRALLQNDAGFREAVSRASGLIASHHGRESGICPELFDDYHCKPFFVVISDKGYQHDTQETVPYYRSKALGSYFGTETRHVLTTRNDGAIRFRFLPDGKWFAESLATPANRAA